MAVEADQISSRLLELQTRDRSLRELRERVESHDSRLDGVEEPAQQLSEEVEVLSEKLRTLHVEERRVRRASEEKRQRMLQSEARLKRVRTLRQEAAAQSELALLGRAREQDEMELSSTLDQIGKFEERLADRQAALEAERDAVQPRRAEILADKDAAQSELDAAVADRDRFASEIDRRHLAVYEQLARRGRGDVVSRMTEDGACGVCFSVMPLQLQNEIRTSAPLVRCEACGVIITSPE